MTTSMHLMESIRIALGAIWANKVRSLLVMLGNVIAVASIIAVVSIVDGMNSYMQEKVFAEGSGVVRLSRIDEMQILTDLDAFLESIYNPPLTLDDREFLLDHLPSATEVGAQRSTRSDMIYRDERMKGVSLRGYTSNYPILQNIELDAGRHFTEMEFLRSRSVAVLGSDVAENLFGDLDPLGRKIRVGRRPFAVIGITEAKGSVMGESQDAFVAIPLTTFQKITGRHGRARSLTITAMTDDTENVPQLMDEMRIAMRQHHRLRPGDKDDFAITTSDRLLSLWSKIKNMLLGVLMMIVGISAVVAGIVIMNIMLVSVQERTREIGIRKAIGARSSDILWQFLIEALTLSICGGLIGIQLGYLTAAIIAAASPLPYATEFWSVVMGMVLTVAVGGFFGIYPARRAAKLDPVEALHYE
ncbi:MAG: FtsX-like permease family protein [bacterium]|nr:FtsX-like permease family protein [bacterium]